MDEDIEDEDEDLQGSQDTSASASASADISGLAPITENNPNVVTGQ